MEIKVQNFKFRCAAVTAAVAGSPITISTTVRDAFGNLAAVASDAATVLQVSAAPAATLTQVR